MSIYDQLGVRTTEEILTSMDVKPLTKEDMLEQNIKDLHKELNEAYTRIHQLQDIISEITHKLEQSIQYANKRWEY